MDWKKFRKEVRDVVEKGTAPHNYETLTLRKMRGDRLSKEEEAKRKRARKHMLGKALKKKKELNK